MMATTSRCTLRYRLRDVTRVARYASISSVHICVSSARLILGLCNPNPVTCRAACLFIIVNKAHIRCTHYNILYSEKVNRNWKPISPVSDLTWQPLQSPVPCFDVDMETEDNVTGEHIKTCHLCLFEGQLKNI